MSVHAAASMSTLSTGGLGTDFPSEIPFYFFARKNLVGGVPDTILALVSHHIVYWILCGAFDFLDRCRWKWLDRYRIREPDEIESRNLVSRSEVIATVISQQALQTAIGLIILADVPGIPLSRCGWEPEAMENTLLDLAQLGFIPKLLASMLAFHKREIAYWVYWWIIPTSQLILAM